MLGNHVIRNARGLVVGGVGIRRAALPRARPGAPPPRAAGAGPARRRALRAQPRLPPRRAARPAGGARRCTNAAWLDASRSSACGASPRPCSGPTGHRRSSTTAGSTWRRGSSLDEPAAGVSAFPETGYVVVRSPRLWLAFDCGAPAPPSCPPTPTPTRSRYSSGGTGGRARRHRHRHLRARARSGTGCVRPRALHNRARRAQPVRAVARVSRRPLPRGPPRSRRGGRARGPRPLAGGLTHVRRVTWSGRRGRDLRSGRGQRAHRIVSRLVLAPGERAAAAEPVGGSAEVERDSGRTVRRAQRDRDPRDLARGGAAMPSWAGGSVP